MSYSDLYFEYLNCWWRYRVNSRDLKVGQISSNDHHYKIIKSYEQIFSVFLSQDP